MVTVVAAVRMKLLHDEVFVPRARPTMMLRRLSPWTILAHPAKSSVPPVRGLTLHPLLETAPGDRHELDGKKASGIPETALGAFALSDLVTRPSGKPVLHGERPTA